MTISLVTFSDASMERSRRLCVESAKRYGVDNAIECVATDNLTERGLGFWKWKPRIIHNLLSGEDSFARLNDSYLIYADAGVEFVNNVRYIIDRMDQDIFLFGNNWEHAHWCKRDAVEAVWPFWQRGRLLRGADARMVDDRTVKVFVGREYREINLLELAWERFGKQAQASVIFFRISGYTRAFVKEWLDWCLSEGGRLIDDSPSRTPNHPEFREHRHDQAILTTMAYREGLRLHYWPAMYNDGAFTYERLPEYAGDDYPTLFHHHRRRNHEWEAVV